MKIFGFIFHIGIVFITFHIIWWLFMFVLKGFLGREKTGRIKSVENLLKPISLVLLAAVAALKAHEFVEDSSAPWHIYVYAAIGVFLLLAYLIEKMRKSPVQIRINNGRIDVGHSTQSTSDKVLLGIISALFILFIVRPELVRNPFTLWLSQAIHDIYETPVIGWVIAIMGAFFLVRMILVAIVSLQNLTGKVKQQQQRRKDGTDSEGFTDYEIVDDDPDEPTDGPLLN